MKVTVLLLALTSALILAADNAAIAPHSAANLQSTVAGHRSSVIGGTEAITIPQMLSYQGKLTDTLGVPVPTGNYALTFRLYTQPTGGSAIWTEAQTIMVRNGLFSALLGAVTPITSVPDAGALHLSLQVAADPELSPRLRIVSAAYAYLTVRAANSDLLQGKDTAALDARYVNESQASSVTGAMMVDGTVSSADIRDTTVNTTDLKNAAVTMTKLNQDGAASGQVIKWTGSAWAPRNDSLGVADNAWVRVGADSVLYTIRRLGIARGGAGNALYGESTRTHVNLGVACTTGMSGQVRYYCTVGGGGYNNATGTYATVGGGRGNRADTVSATVAGGYFNGATGYAATVGGGYTNNATANYATVAGGGQNSADAINATVGGGINNAATGNFATVGGGSTNAATGVYTTLAGGRDNSADTIYATVGGGYSNAATGVYTTIAGGRDNSAHGDEATVGGGYSNVATGNYATVAGGYNNSADAIDATVGGGYYNTASGLVSTVGGGDYNAASGYGATIPGGYQCDASGPISFAAGTYAKARGAGSFVWSDSCGAADSVRTATDNRWMARARGGVYFYTNLGMTTGSYLSAGGSSWNSVSDSMTKENFRPVDKKALLEAVARMRVRDYNLKTQEASIRHIGPVAQDFHSAFGFGESNTAINMEDADGVLMAAVQALNEQNQNQQAEIEALKAKLAGK